MAEETGSISIVVNGQSERGLDADGLRARLRSLILQRDDRAPAQQVQYT